MSKAHSYALDIITESVVSMRFMPAANSIGRQSVPYSGMFDCVAPADMASNATSVAVSNPSPKSNPIGYTCQLLVTKAKSLPKILLMKPRESSIALNALSS